MEDKEPSFQSPPHASTSSDAGIQSSFVTSDQLKQISDQWAEQFARFEALLSRGNVFSTPKTTVKPMPPHTVVSESLFIAPARLIGPVEVPAKVESNHTKSEKTKTKSRKP